MPSEQRNVTATSLFVVGEIGVNDYLIGLLGNRTLSELKTVFLPRIISAIRSAVTVSRRLPPNTLLPVPDAIRNTIVCQFVTRLHILAWSHIQDVIAAGACTVVVPGAIPLGCEPELLTLYQGRVGAGGYDPESGCITSLNDLAELHNRELRRMLGDLRRAHSGSGTTTTSIVYADLYRAVTDIIVSPGRYGTCAPVRGG